MWKKHKKGATSSKEKGKRKAKDQGNINPFGILFRDTAQKARFDALSKRKILGTRYIDVHTIDTLGIKDDIWWMIGRLGWEDLMSIRYPTYPRLTLEFLSSLEAEILSGMNCEEGKISFRIFNNEISLTLADFNSMFHLPIGGERGIPRQFSDYEFWREIASTDERYNPSKSKSSALQNPVFRYLHRVMANTVFGRGDSDGVVRQSELLMLWAMIHEVNIDTGSYVVRHMLRIGRGTSGTIIIGGFITRIAITLGYDLNGLESIENNQRIDIEALQAMKMIIRDGGQFCLVLKDYFPLPLPNPERTTVQNRDNWLMRNMVPPPNPSPPTNTVPPSIEPSRHSSAFGSHFAGSSAYNFDAVRSSLDAIRAEQAIRSAHLDELCQTYRNAEQFMDEAVEFFAHSREFLRSTNIRRNRQDRYWDEEEETRSTIQSTALEFDAMYEWHEYLGHMERLPQPRIPHPPPY